MKETSNPVVWQSRTWLMDALAALMEEKKFEEITCFEAAANACAGSMSGVWNGIPPILRRISQRCIFRSGKSIRHFCSLYAGMIRSAASSRCPIRTGPKFTAVCNRTGKKP